MPVNPQTGQTPDPEHGHTTLTLARVKELATVIGQGNYPATACRTLGIKTGTYHDWKKAGVEHRDAGLTHDDSLQVLLVEMVDAALSRGEEAAVNAWTSAMGSDWRAAMEFLGRRFPDRWARPDRDQRGAQVATEVVEIRLTMGGPQSAFLYRDPDYDEDSMIEGDYKTVGD